MATTTKGVCGMSSERLTLQDDETPEATERANSEAERPPKRRPRNAGKGGGKQRIKWNPHDRLVLAIFLGEIERRHLAEAQSAAEFASEGFRLGYDALHAQYAEKENVARARAKTIRDAIDRIDETIRGMLIPRA